MITKESILRKHLGEELFKDMSEWLIFPQPSGSFPMIDLIYSAIDELIQEDRKNVAEHATLIAYYEPEEWDELIEEELEEEGNYVFPYLRSGKVIFLNKDSIINAPNLKLR